MQKEAAKLISVLTSLAELEFLLRTETVFALDIETTGLNPYGGDSMIGVGFYFPQSQKGLYLPVKWDCENPTLFQPAFEAKAVEVKRLFHFLKENITENHIVIGQNIKFDLSFLPSLPCRVLDSMVLAHFIDENKPKHLKNLEKEYLNTATKATFDLATSRITEYPLETISAYCINDARLAWAVVKELFPKVKELNMEWLTKLQMKYLKIVLEMERIGFALSLSEAEKHLAAVKKIIKELERQLFERCGERFNWKSPQQMEKILYTKLGVSKPPGIKEDSKKRLRGMNVFTSTMTSSFILKEKAHHPLADLVADLRHTDKLAQYIAKLIEFAGSSLDKRVHSHFSLTGTRTGRLSSSKPNLQNLPGAVLTSLATRPGSLLKQQGVSLEADRLSNIRRLFIAPEGSKLVSFDYKQMEIRMFAVVADEPKMLEYLAAGKDIHAEAAEAVWGVRDDTHREWAKIISFGLIYGMGSKSVSFRFQMSDKEANALQEKYLKKFPRILEYEQEVMELMRSQKYILYWSGRRRRISDPNLFYRAVNAAVQGGCADLLALATCRLWNYLQIHQLSSQIVNLIHDEILLEMPEEEFAHIPAIKRIVEVEDAFNLPFVVDIKTGQNWGEMEKYENLSS